MDSPKNHTPGPWAWFGNEHGIYLATTHSGRRYVMGFARMGMQGAQPRFQVNSRMVDGADLVEFEVSDKAKGFTAGKAEPEVYRLDITGIDHPDARLIAQAWTIPQLRAALKYARRFLNAEDHDIEFVDAALKLGEEA